MPYDAWKLDTPAYLEGNAYEDEITEVERCESLLRDAIEALSEKCSEDHPGELHTRVRSVVNMLDDFAETKTLLRMVDPFSRFVRKAVA